MNALTKKTILIISQQGWGTMFLSKHHYALELAKNGNLVYFLNPPVYTKPHLPEKVTIAPSNSHPNLFLVTNNLSFPYNIKFHFISLFHLFMRSHIKAILKKINKPIDIVWSFDISYVYPFRFFPKDSIKIFHPVDDPRNHTGIDAAKGADYIFSTAEEILRKFKSFKVPKHFINHGIANEFIVVKKTAKTDNVIRIGFSGNFLRADIDRKILLQIIAEHPTYIFEFWGTYEAMNANVGSANDASTDLFITSLKAIKNIILHGPVSTSVLASELQRMDAFLICYDLTVENRPGPNYHKLLEYISTGKVIVSNYISVYKDKPRLVQMVKEQNHNLSLPTLFANVINDLANYNSKELQNQRFEFAKDNTYIKQLERIDSILQLSPGGN